MVFEEEEEEGVVWCSNVWCGWFLQRAVSALRRDVTGQDTPRASTLTTVPSPAAPGKTRSPQRVSQASFALVMYPFTVYYVTGFHIIFYISLIIIM